MGQPDSGVKYLVGSLLLSLSLGVHALPRHAPVPGGVAVIDLGPSNASPPSALWGDQPLAVVKEGGRWFALLGIPLDTLPGELEIRVTADGDTLAKTVAIAVKNYPEQRLTIKDNAKKELGLPAVDHYLYFVPVKADDGTEITTTDLPNLGGKQIGGLKCLVEDSAKSELKKLLPGSCSVKAPFPAFGTTWVAKS